MKLYDSTMAPNPRRVRIFLAEKGLDPRPRSGRQEALENLVNRIATLR